MKTKFAEIEMPSQELTLRGLGRPRPPRARSRTILLMSDDTRFHAIVRAFANTLGLLVVRAEPKAGTIAILQATKPVAVLLDLDLPGAAAWEVADLLLNEPGCPAVVLLTGRTSQFDTETANRAGSLVRKDESPCRLLEIVQETLSMLEVNQAERNAIQRVLIRWLRPFQWPEAPAYRFWDINE
jgi:CheY-like chemotaxis protein